MATWFQFEKNLYQVRETFASVPANSSSARLDIPLGTFGGRFTQVAMHTANCVEFDFRIYQNATSVAGTVDEIYRVTGANQFWQKESLDIHFLNTDAPQVTKLFLELDNKSLVAPTGTITLQLYIHAPGTGVV